MKSFENLEKWVEKKDKIITLAHDKKDRNSLKKNLDNLKKEQNSIINELHKIDMLINSIDMLHEEKTKISEERIKDLEEYRSWLKELKKLLKEFAKKPKETLTAEEKEFLEREEAKLGSEKTRWEKHLSEIDKIIAKSTILLIDINETYCRDLSGGHSVSSVGEVLKGKFGDKLELAYSVGRWKMIKLLENHFNIKRREAVQLFDLMIDTNVIIYNVDIPSTVSDMNFYTPYMGEFMDDIGIVEEPVYGYWIINA